MYDLDEWIAKTRAGIEEDRLRPDVMTEEEAEVFGDLAKFGISREDFNRRLEAQLNFCEMHRARLVGTGGDVNLWGFGTVHAVAAPEEGGWWINLIDLVEPTGMTYAELDRQFKKALDETSVDGGENSDVYQAFWWDTDENVTAERYVNHNFTMRMFTFYSPWRDEFYNNIKDLMTHGLIKAVGEEKLNQGTTYVVEQNSLGEDVLVETGIGMGEVLRQGLPSEEVARHQAFQGPLGAFDHDN